MCPEAPSPCLRAVLEASRRPLSSFKVDMTSASSLWESRIRCTAAPAAELLQGSIVLVARVLLFESRPQWLRQTLHMLPFLSLPPYAGDILKGEKHAENSQDLSEAPFGSSLV